jgi:hypothetical protein
MQEFGIRRRAGEIALMLPESQKDARAILEQVRWLVENYSYSSQASPNLRAIASDKSPVLPSSIHPIDRPSIRETS